MFNFFGRCLDGYPHSERNFYLLASCLALAFKVDIKDEAISRAFSVKHLILGITDALKEAKEITSLDQAVPLEPGYWKKHLQILPKEEHLGALEFGTGFFGWLLRFALKWSICPIKVPIR